MAKIYLGKRSSLQRKFSYLLGKNIIFQESLPNELIKASENFSLKKYITALSNRSVMIKQWDNILKSCKFHFPYKHLISADDIRSSCIQRLIVHQGGTLAFAQFCLESLPPGETEFIIPVPRKLRESLREHGLPINGPYSSLFWIITYCELTTRGLTSSLRAFVQVLSDFIKLRSADASSAKAPNTFFIDLVPSEFGSTKDDLNVVEFVSEKRIPCFAESDTSIFIVNPEATNTTDYHDKGVIVGRNLFQCPGRKAPSITTLIKQFASQAGIFLNVLKSALTNQWQDLILAEEYAALPRANAWFESVRPRHIARSLSGGFSPVWTLMRQSFGCNMWFVFYSTNSGPIEFKGEETPYREAIYNYMLSDYFAVWDEEQKQWLESYGYSSKQIFVCGPIIYCHYPKVKERLITNVEHKTPRIVCFDLVPLEPNVLLKHGMLPGYCTTDVAIQFVNDLYNACIRVYGAGNFNLSIKPKRLQVPVHSSRYWDFINEMQRKNQLTVLSPKSNPFLPIQDSDAVVNALFTSTALIAQYCNVPTCFYDPTGKVANPYHLETRPLLINGFDPLVKWLEQLNLAPQGAKKA